MISKWKPGTLVRVIADDPTKGMVGTVQATKYAEFLPATSVVLDEDAWQLAAFYLDDELEALEESE